MDKKIIDILEKLISDVGGIKIDITDIKTDINGLKTDVSGLKTDVSGLKTDVSGLKTDVSGLKTDVSYLKKNSVTKDDLKVALLKQRNEISEDFANIVNIVLEEVDNAKTNRIDFEKLEKKVNKIEQKIAN